MIRPHFPVFLKGEVHLWNTLLVPPIFRGVPASAFSPPHTFCHNIKTEQLCGAPPKWTRHSFTEFCAAGFTQVRLQFAVWFPVHCINQFRRDSGANCALNSHLNRTQKTHKTHLKFAPQPPRTCLNQLH